uniref:MlaB-like STAS domain-containing protein n=1 Tax=Rhodopseudomonas palustris (strain BisA53) TaxID=316055 RepID=Q07SE1_RHOP5
MVTTSSALNQTPDRLPQLLDIVQAKDLCDSLIFLIAQGPVRLDASDVERMSTPSAQVMLAAGRAADAAGIDFKIVDASEVFRNGLQDLGLRAEFTKWMV